MIVLRSPSESGSFQANSLEVILINLSFVLFMILAYIVFKICKVLYLLLVKAEQILSK